MPPPDGGDTDALVLLLSRLAGLLGSKRLVAASITDFIVAFFG
ncbi:MAG: hypothetical protein WC473_03805 [Patescibacteria group bacterium]